MRRVDHLGLKHKYFHDLDFRFWINRFIALALIDLKHIEEGMKVIIQTMPNEEQATIKFVKYFAKQWLNGNQSPEIWNHHNTIDRRTNNGLEGLHNCYQVVSDRPHPHLQVGIDLFKRENSLATDKFAKLNQNYANAKKSTRLLEKDEIIFQIHQEFLISETTFQEYFEKLTNQVCFINKEI